MTWQEIVKNDERYEDFKILDNPVKFKEMFADKDFSRVQLHSTQVYQDKYIVGFCGVFEWQNNKIIPLDSDSYSDNTTVLGYDTYEDEGDECLEILVGNDW